MKLSLKQKIWLIALAICAAGFCISWAAFSFKEGRREQAEIRLSRAEGLPIEPADLRTGQVPESENAAVDIQDAYALGHSRCLEAYKLFEREFIVQTEDGVRRLSRGPDSDLEQLQPLVVCLRKAAAKPKLDFKRNWSDAPKLSFDFDEVQTGIRILIADAERRDRQGDFAGGTAEFVDAARLSSLIAQEPDLFSALTAFTCETTLEYELEGTLWRAGPTPWALERIKRTIDAMGSPPSLRHTLSGELVMQRVTLRLLNQANLREMVGRTGRLGALRFSKVAFVRAAFDASLLESWRRLYHLLPRDNSDPLKTKEVLTNWDDWVAKQTDWSYTYAQVFGFGYQGVVMLQQAQLARRRILATLAELLQQRAKGEKFAGQLSRTPDHHDPFGTGTLRVLIKPGGFTVYSLGPDGVDQGGLRYESLRYSNARPNLVAEYPGIEVKFKPIESVNRPNGGYIPPSGGRRARFFEGPRLRRN